MLLQDTGGRTIWKRTRAHSHFQPLSLCAKRDSVLQRGCGFRLLESSIPGALPHGCNASLQRLLSLCLEFVNDLVSIIPGIELLISRVVMDHGVTP